MLSPDYILKLSEGAEMIASQLHEDIVNAIVKRIAARLGRGDSYILTAQDKWQLEVLQDAGFLREDIQKEIAKRTKLQYKEIKAAFEDAGVKALSYDAAVYKAAGLASDPLSQSPFLIRLLEQGYNATLTEWNNYTRTTAASASGLFIRECDRAYNLVLSGTVGYGQACKEAVERIAKDGVKVVYPSGHEDTIETATMRAVRTGVAQVCGNITAQRAAEMGITCFLTSSHLGARPTHELWQGQVFWVDWDKLAGVLPIDTSMAALASEEEKAKYREFVETTEIGTITGLCGVNCRHSYMPFVDGISSNPFEKFDSEENKKRYELEQKQRSLERRIRKTKREVLALNEARQTVTDEATKAELEEAYQKKAAQLQAQNKEYKDFCKENDLKTQQERLEIANWNRSQAAQATAAARRENAASTFGTPQASGSVGDTNGYSTITAIRSIDVNDAQAVQKELDAFAEKYKDVDIEHSLVISPNGKVYEVTGLSSVVHTNLVGKDALAGSTVIHNHPVWRGTDKGDSFSRADILFAAENKTGLQILVSGNRKDAFYFIDHASENEIKEAYSKAFKDVLKNAFDNEAPVVYEQEETARRLSQYLKGFVFYDGI